MLNDDRVIVRKINSQYLVFGTPWVGECGIVSNISAPLSGIYFITHGVTNAIMPISPQEAVSQLLPTLSIPFYDREIVTSMFDFCDDLLLNLPIFELICTPTPDVVDVVMDHISKHEA